MTAGGAPHAYSCFEDCIVAAGEAGEILLTLQAVLWALEADSRVRQHIPVITLGAEVLVTTCQAAETTKDA